MSARMSRAQVSRAQVSRAQARRDPTRMANQPALRSSDGTIWIVVAGLFVLICLIPLSLLTVIDPRSSAPVAWVTAILVIGLYAALVVSRWAVGDRERRLRLMAGLMIAIAAIALLGLVICAVIEWSAVPVAPVAGSLL
ncbi:hypothetical protein LG322_04405 [Microbacterium aerolatum]|uniref:Uncharacterized protein n=1 Tax=Microbacterium aerolatum TaxID=153731 RepID=A0A511AFY9_9MICO|nr:hypothetical protein [Microbacterium aerolatum]GEK87064.1 hypothetical protein MAE01_22400 [Microbacterium aerolatum]GGB35727.1 hypothetical protein GCM10007198_27790 [Microbacterium aerolatum]